MVGRIVRRGTGAFLVVLAAVLAVLVGVATPAWADELTNTTENSPATSASDLASKLGLDQSNVDTASNTITIPNDTVVNSGPIVIAPQSEMTIVVAGTFTINQEGSEGAGILVLGTSTLNITGSGTLKGGGNDWPVLQVGRPDRDATPTVFINMSGGSIVAADDGYALFADTGSSVTLQDGTLKGGNTSTAAVVVGYPDYSGTPGNFTMVGGTITPTEGAKAIAAEEAGVVELKSGTVNGDASGAGGSLTLDGANVKGEISSNGTGTVDFESGTAGSVGSGVTIHPDRVMVTVETDGSSYVAVGGEDVVANVPANSTVTVNKAPAGVNLKVPMGVIVKNQTGIEIGVNGDTLASGHEVTVSESDAPETPDNSTIVPDGESFPKTGDSTLSVTAAVAALGFGILATAVLVKRQTR